MRTGSVVSSIAIAAMLLNGCGIAGQALVGFTDVRTVEEGRASRVKFNSDPEGAQVTREAPDGTKSVLGPTPLVDVVPYAVSRREEVTKGGLMFGIGIAETVIGFFMGFAGLTASLFDDCNDFGAADSCESSSVGPTLGAIGGTAFVFGIVDTAWGFMRMIKRNKTSESVIGEPTYTYELSKPGYAVETQKVLVPSSKLPTFRLARNGSKTNDLPRIGVRAPSNPTDAAATRTISEAEKKWIIAVMNVEDANAGEEGGMSVGLVRNLSDQMRVYIAQQGMRTIDRSAQERALRDQVGKMKQESYQNCYDDNCQIELGKALAATHIMRTKITRFGRRCVLNGELIDLKAEVTVKAASSRGACEAEGFLEMSEAVTRDLVTR